MTLVLHMLKEVCEHLNLRDTSTSQKFLELAKHTDVSALARQLENSDAGAVAGRGVARAQGSSERRGA